MPTRTFVPTTRLLALLGGWDEPRPAVPGGGRGAKYEVLADAIACRIADGEISGGLRLPSERELAGRLGVSRGTVVSAYSVLERRRLVERQQGSGTWVRSLVAPVTAADQRPGLWSLYRPAPRDGVVDNVIDLAIGAPRKVPDLVADGLEWAAAQLRGMVDHGYHAGGLEVARHAIADRYTRAGVPTEPEQIVVTAGAQSALSLLGRLFLSRHAPIAVELPAYPGAVEAFQRAGGHLMAIDRDADGARPEVLARALSHRPTPLFYVVPDVHNPTGDVMPLQRRRRLLAVAQEHDTLVIEDGALTQLAAAPPPPSLLELAPRGRVLHVGSASKELWGGLRVGWIRAENPQLVDRIVRLQAADSFGTDVVGQLALAWMLPRTDEAAAATRAALLPRMRRLRDAIARALPEWHAHPPRGGGSLWVRLPAPLAGDLQAHGRHLGVTLVPGAACGMGTEFDDHIRLSAWGRPEELEEGVRRLAQAWAATVAGDRVPEPRVPRPWADGTVTSP